MSAAVPKADSLSRRAEADFRRRADQVCIGRGLPEPLDEADEVERLFVRRDRFAHVPDVGDELRWDGARETFVYARPPLARLLDKIL